MTRIDFHSNVADPLGYACRLIRKARSHDCRIVVWHDQPALLAQLDAALWSFTQEDFLPHVMAGDPAASLTPVILTDDDNAPCPHYDLLINLCTRIPAGFERFERMIEIVGSDEAARQAGRERYRHYQQLGHPLTHSVAK